MVLRTLFSPGFHNNDAGGAEEQRDIYIPAWFGLAVIAALVLTALACPICTAIVAASKGRWSTGWFAIGLVFGPFGLLAAIGVTSLAPVPVELVDYKDGIVP